MQYSAVDFTLSTPKKCYSEAFNGVGNGDFSLSLVRHKALTAQKIEPTTVSVTDDTGKAIVCVKFCSALLHILKYTVSQN